MQLRLVSYSVWSPATPPRGGGGQPEQASPSQHAKGAPQSQGHVPQEVGTNVTYDIEFVGVVWLGVTLLCFPHIRLTLAAPPR